MPVGPPPEGEPAAVLNGWRRAPVEPPSGPPDVPPPSPEPVTAFRSWFDRGVCDCDPPTAPPCDAGVCCDGCLGNRWYGSAEYLLWWVKGSPLPPLVTAGSAGDPNPGALGLPGTVVLFGDRDVGSGARSGGRFTLGYWFGDRHLLGLEGSFFFLGSHTTSFSDTSFGSPMLFRPFIDATTGRETTEFVAVPGMIGGTITASLRSSLWGYETNFRGNAVCCPCCQLDWIAGFRALGLDEDLQIREQLSVLQANRGGAFDLRDQFTAHNRFYGGQLGAVAKFQRGNWTLDLTSKVALGSTTQMVDVFGSTVIADPVNGTTTSSGGLLAQNTNGGRHTRDTFTVVPEVGLSIGYQWTERLRCYVGYNFLYWSEVARPGNQIDRVVNPNLLAPPLPGGPARPAFAFHGSDFWAQGINFGIEYRY
jgi:hypothetical protein